MPDYDYLITDVKNTTENDGTEFSAQLPKIVNKAENKLTTDLDDHGLTVYTSIAIPSGQAIVSIPSGTRIVRNFSMTQNGSRKNMLLRTMEFVNDFWPVSASTSAPIYYAYRGNTEIRIAPTPASTHNGEIMTVVRPTTLTSTGTTSNYFTDFCYDALFAACMVESCLFMKDATATQLWETQYQYHINALRNQARRTRQDDMAVNASPAGGPDTLIRGST